MSLNRKIWDEIKDVYGPFNCRMVMTKTGLDFSTISNEMNNLIKLGFIQYSESNPFFYQIIHPEKPINIDPHHL